MYRNREKAGERCEGRAEEIQRSDARPDSQRHPKPLTKLRLSVK